MRNRIAIGFALACASLRSDSPDLRMQFLDVIAIDSRGEPVRDLTQADFEITDANKPQKIALFRNRDANQWRVPQLTPHEFSNRTNTGVPHATILLLVLLQIK